MPTSQTLLSATALAMLGMLGGCLVFHAVPTDNRELLSTIVGAIAGALMMGGAQHLASKIKAPGLEAKTEQEA